MPTIREVMDAKSKYDHAQQNHHKYVETMIHKQNLNLDNDNHLDQIVEIELQADHLYHTNELYSNYIKLANKFILDNLDNLITDPNVPQNIKQNAVDIRNTITQNPGYLIIYRDQLLSIFSKI